MKKLLFFPFLLMTLGSCASKLGVSTSKQNLSAEEQASKPVIYQVFTRLFGNTNQTNKPWGTKAENGVGKFADFTPKALNEIKALGTTHIWYTGVLHHAMVADYSEYGISSDDPDVIKGRAGSPYAIKDYYSVNPDLAVDPAQRVAEFEALIERSHNAGLKVIIDIVPNHVARHYQSQGKPDGVEDLGANDDKSVVYAKHNDFYYIPNTEFNVPDFPKGHAPLGGESHPLVDGQFDENPAKWTGNGSRLAKPHFNDWYETVKVNYGVKPDGSYDFVTLPAEYANKSYQQHYQYWQGKDVPSSWLKMRDIALFWLAKGVDGFRFDMAEMVPVEFWSYLNSYIKTTNPDAALVAEVYNPSLYRDYVKLGKMDYLYDKVGFYDTLKWIMQGKQTADTLITVHQEVSDIATHMLHFLENHDEQRIASPDFVGDMNKGKSAMVVSHLISTSPTLIYFGQDVGEPGAENAGFGSPTRTSIFDYIGVPEHQKWMNSGKFDGALLSDSQKQLRAFYQSLLNLNKLPPVVSGKLVDLTDAIGSAKDNVVAFAREGNKGKIFVLASFSNRPVDVTLPTSEKLNTNSLIKFAGDNKIKLDGQQLKVTLAPFGAVVLGTE